MSDILTIKSFRDGHFFSEHVVSITHTDHHTMEIHELRNILHEPGALAACAFELQPRSYLNADVQLRRGDLRSHMKVAVHDAGQHATVEHNGIVTQQCPIQHHPMLLDGPSPLFDWANAIMLLGICDGESFTLPVHVMDVQSGNLKPTPYSFHRSGQRITVQKGIDGLSDTELVLSSESYEFNVYYAGGIRYYAEVEIEQ